MLRCIRDGRPLSAKSHPLMRNDMRALLKACIALETEGGGEKRWAFASSFQAFVRTGDMSDASWTNSFWDSDDMVPYILWNERKVAKQTWLNFFADYEHYELCWYHSVALALI